MVDCKSPTSVGITGSWLIGSWPGVPVSCAWLFAGVVCFLHLADECVGYRYRNCGFCSMESPVSSSVHSPRHRQCNYDGRSHS